MKKGDLSERLNRLVRMEKQEEDRGDARTLFVSRMHESIKFTMDSHARTSLVAISNLFSDDLSIYVASNGGYESICVAALCADKGVSRVAQRQ